MPDSTSSATPAVSAPAPGIDFDLPAPKRWESLGHIVQELRQPGDFEVRDRGSRLVGWITRLGARYQARGIAAALADAPILGTFLSGRAALRLVIGYYDTEALRRTIIKEVREIEQAFELKTQGGIARDRRPSPRTDAPDRTPPDPLLSYRKPQRH